MLNKLAFRNAKRSFRDYLIYLATMIFITALMFAFDSMIFSKDIQNISSQAGMMGMMIGLATFFIVLIIIWLMHYMIRFMASKRSREFATYLLLGFHKKQIANLFLKETVILGAAAFFIGLIPGILLQQIITTFIYAVVDAQYSIHLELKAGTFLMTAAIFCISYFLALFRNKRRFKKWNIRDMMYLDQQNEESKSGNRSGRQWLFFVSVTYILFFDQMMVSGHTNEWNIYPLIIGLILSIYLLYMGLTAFLIGHIKKERAGVLKGANVFVLRQLSSKVKTMQFTLGTLTLLFIVALMGASHALMLNQFQTTQSDEDWPFDIADYDSNPNYDFAREKALIQKEANVKSEHTYQIFEDHTNSFSHFMKTRYKEDLDNSIADKNAYFHYDTYMKLSDYNVLREMLGHKKVSLDRDQYIIHIKKRLKGAGLRFASHLIHIHGDTYHCKGVYTEGFEQNGHNGADYLLVVPDEAVDTMKPYYSLFMAQTEGSVPFGLEDQLLKCQDFHHSVHDYGYFEKNVDRGLGTDFMYVTASYVFVRATEMRDMKSLLSSLIFPLFYVGLVFLCVALAVLAVQQLSDSAKHRCRYRLLRKLGMSEKELDHVILKQLFFYYLCPFIASILISGGIVLYDGRQFSTLISTSAPSWSYLGISLLLFGSIYGIYFIGTYVQFKRNVGVWGKSLE